MERSEATLHAALRTAEEHVEKAHQDTRTREKQNRWINGNFSGQRKRIVHGNVAAVIWPVSGGRIKAICYKPSPITEHLTIFSSTEYTEAGTSATQQEAEAAVDALLNKPASVL